MPKQVASLEDRLTAVLEFLREEQGRPFEYWLRVEKVSLERAKTWPDQRLQKALFEAYLGGDVIATLLHKGLADLYRRDLALALGGDRAGSFLSGLEAQFASDNAGLATRNVPTDMQSAEHDTAKIWGGVAALALLAMTIFIFLLLAPFFHSLSMLVGFISFCTMCWFGARANNGYGLQPVGRRGLSWSAGIWLSAGICFLASDPFVPLNQRLFDWGGEKAKAEHAAAAAQEQMAHEAEVKQAEEQAIEDRKPPAQKFQECLDGNHSIQECFDMGYDYAAYERSRGLPEDTIAYMEGMLREPHDNRPYRDTPEGKQFLHDIGAAGY